MFEVVFTIAFYTIAILLIANRISSWRRKKRLERYLKVKEEAEARKANDSKITNKENEVSSNLTEDKDETLITNLSKKIFGSENNKYNEPNYRYFTMQRDNDDKAEISGRQGEHYIFKELKRTKEFNITYANVYIPIKGDNTSEIDLIMITEYGIFIIESKNYNGWIFGRDSDNKWTVMYNKNSKVKFYNPIMQNDSHVMAISNYLELPIDSFKSYVVFGGKSELKDITISRSDVEVIKHYEVRRSINRALKNSKKIFTKEQVEQIAKMIEKHTDVSNEIKEKHIANAKKYKKSAQ